MALVFFDLDGTILIDGQIVPGTKSLMDQLRRRGHKVAIATGRNPNLLKGIDKALGIKHLVLANGGYVLSDDKVIYENYVPYTVVERLMDKADQYPFDLTIEYFDAYVAYRQDTNKSLIFSQHFDLPIAYYDHKRYPNRKVFAFLVFENDVVEDIQDDFPELQFNLSGGIAYDVNPSGDLKARGVREMIHHLGYDLNDVYAFGDNYNDIKMFKAVGHSIAMGNGVQALKDIAEYVTDNHDGDGIKKALIHYGLI